MLVLLDESLPRALGRALPGHEVRTVPRMGWASIGNGALLRLAAANGFGALVTADRNLEYQQNVARAGVGVVVLVAGSTRIQDILSLAPSILEALATLQPGQVVRVGGRSVPDARPAAVDEEHREDDQTVEDLLAGGFEADDL